MGKYQYQIPIQINKVTKIKRKNKKTIVEKLVGVVVVNEVKINIKEVWVIKKILI